MIATQRDYPCITLPPELEGYEIIASVSGGKDSTALMLALREAGIPFRAVFADTGWEHSGTYRYLDLLRERVGPIDVVRATFDPELLASTLSDLGVPEGWIPCLSQSAMVARCILGRAGSSRGEPLRRTWTTRRADAPRGPTRSTRATRTSAPSDTYRRPPWMRASRSSPRRVFRSSHAVACSRGGV